MSAPHPALTSPEQTALASASTVRSYLLVAPVATPFATARVASTPTFPVKNIAVSGTSADWLNCRFGQTVWIGSAAGLNDRGVYYLRTVPTSGLAKIGEVGRSDAGSETTIDRDTPISSGDYITVWETYNLHAGRSTIAYSYGTESGVFYKFSDRAYNGENLKPQPYWQGDNWKAIRLPTGSSTITSSFTLTAVPFLGSQSVSSYAWTVPSAFTSVSGAGTATVSFHAPNGFWVLYCQAVLADGTSATAIRYLWVYGDTGDVVPIEVVDISDTRDRAARKASLTLVDDVRGQIDSTGAVMVVDEITYADGTVDTATVRFCGWLGTGSGDIEYGKRGSTIEVLGSGAVLATLGADSQRLEQASVPANWQQAIAGLLTANYFAYYLLEYGVVNFTALFNYYPLDDAVPQSVNPWDAPANSNYMAQIQAVAQRCQYANIGTDSDGDLHFHLDPPFIDPASRSGLVSRASITPDICSAVTYNENTHPQNRLIVSSAFIYNGTTMSATRAWSPGRGSGQATGEEELPGIIVDSESTNELFSGLYYAWANVTYETITFAIPGNWDVIEPAHMQRVPYTVDAQYSPTGEELSGYGVVVSVNKRRDPGGASWIDLTVRPETTGTAGDPYPYPPEVTPVYGDVGLTSFVPLLPSGGTYGHETNFDPTTASASLIKFVLLAQKSDRSVWAVIRVNQKDPTWKAVDISPTSGQMTALGAPIKLVRDPTNKSGYFLLCESGIAYTSNAQGKTVTWTVVSTPTDDRSIIYDFTLGDQGFTALTSPTATPTAVYAPGVGWQTADWGPQFSHYIRDNFIQITIPAATITKIAMYYSVTHGPNPIGTPLNTIIGINGSTVETGTDTDTANGILTFTGSSPASTLIQARVIVDGETSLVALAGTSTIKKIIITITGAGANISDIAISNRGNIYWLTKQNVSGTDYVFCNFTRDGFKNSFSTQVALWDANLTYQIQISAYNPANIWVTAGTPGTDAAIYFSSNGAVSFTAGATLKTRGGAFSVPRSLPRGGANKFSANILYVKGIDTDLIAVRDGSSPATVSAGSSDYPATNDVLAQSPINGNWAALVLKSGSVYTSIDGGKTFALAGTVPGSGNANSLKQWPNNHKYLLAGGAAMLAYTIDAGVNWTDIYSDFTTWSNSEYGSGVITEIVTALLAEWTIFKVPVV